MFIAIQQQPPQQQVIIVQQPPAPQPTKQHKKFCSECGSDLTLECNVCFDEINRDENLYKGVTSVGYVCEECQLFFSKGSLEIIMHVTNVNRGRFGIIEDQLILIKGILREMNILLRENIRNQINYIRLNEQIELRAKEQGLNLIFK